MAAAALLRSVARKLARAPPPYPLARGLRDGALSGPGSLPPPTSNQIQQGLADRLAVGMAAAADLRSGAGLPSSARKIAREAPQGYHRRLHERRLHSSTSPNLGASGSTPPPTSDKDLIENLRFRLEFAKVLAGVAGTVAIYLYFWALPEAKAEAYSRGAKKLESILVEHAEIMQNSGIAEGEELLHLFVGRKEYVRHAGHGGTRVDKSEVDEVLKAFPVMKAIADGIKDIHADAEEIGASIKNHRAAAAELTAALKSALPEG